MIQQVTMYECVCDNCGKVIEFGEGWTKFEQQHLQDWIDNEEKSMQIIDGKHICDSCITLDDEGNTIIIQQKN